MNRWTHALLTTIAWLACAHPAQATQIVQDEAVPQNPLEQAALDAARSQIAAPDRLQAQSIRLMPAVGTEFDSGSIRLVSVDGPNHAGMIRVELQLLADDATPRPYRATIRARVLGPALVAERTLLRKATVDPAALRVVESDLTRLPQAPLRSAHQLEGLVPSRTLSTGRVLYPDLLEAEPLVRKGEPIELLYRSGGVRLTLQATALEDAAEGESATARVGSSGTRVSGMLDADGRLQVRQKIR